MINSNQLKLIWTLQDQQVCGPGVGLPRAATRSPQWQSFREETGREIQFIQVFYFRTYSGYKAVSSLNWQMFLCDTAENLHSRYGNAIKTVLPHRFSQSCKAFPGYDAFIRCLKHSWFFQTFPVSERWLSYFTRVVFFYKDVDLKAQVLLDFIIIGCIFLVCICWRLNLT